MLGSGSRLGPYEIVSALGAGGMGEVYRARDLRLGRDVAIKVLPAAFSADLERLQRFEQEARSAATLNHPNILAVYDIGQHDGAPYIVSELLEGETLRERLIAGPIPVRKAVEYAIQIAHGLAAAHEKGIVHRDLKPENVFVTSDGRVKILDFGLAKLTQAEPALAGLSALSTTPPNTTPGVVLGTIGYMAPEQVRGLAADHRSDIFAYGAVLYEMLASRRAFQGDTTADTTSAILKENPPDLPAVERRVPPGLVRIVDRCLEKTPARRFHSASDLAFGLEGLSSTSEELLASGARQARPLSGRIGWFVAAFLALVLGSQLPLTIAYLLEPTIESSSTRFAVTPPDDAAFEGAGSVQPVVSPDGRSLVFRARRLGGAALLWVRPFDSLEARPLFGTEGTSLPFWSPDSRSIAFFAEGKLKKIDVSGGAPQTLCDAPDGRGGTWNADGVIVFSPAAFAGLSQVSAMGGEPSAVTQLDLSKQEISHRWPQFLPDGRRFLFLVQPGNSIQLGSLDSPEVRTLLNADSQAVYSTPGHLLFVRGRTLMAQPFDLTRGEVSGTAFPIAEQLDVIVNPARATFSVSRTGTLAYVSEQPLAQFRWFDRSGNGAGNVGEPGPYGDFDLSLDDRYVVATDLTGSGSVWVIDTARGAATRVSSSRLPGEAVWAPDMRRFAYRVPGTTSIVEQPASGGPERTIGEFPGLYGLEDWSHDGRFLALEVAEGDRRRGLVVPVHGGDVTVAADSNAFLDEFHFSPDGRWIAYNADESGRHEVYVAPLPPTSERWQVSTGGGVQGRWRGDGRELYYLAPDGSMTVVEMVPSSPPQFRSPKVLFKTGLVPSAGADQYHVSNDGERFLLRREVENRMQSPIVIVTNWAVESSR